MSVVSSTDVECFRRLTNPEVVDVNGAGTTTRQIAQQMRQAMEQVVAAQQQQQQQKQTEKHGAGDHSDSSDGESEASREKARPPPAKAAAPASRLATAMLAAAQTPSPAPPAPSCASAAQPASLPVVPPTAPVRPTAAAPGRAPSPPAEPEEKNKDSDSSDDEQEKEAAQDAESHRLEKQGFLIELQALQAKGVRLSRAFSMKDSLTELEFELQKQNSNLSSAAAVANMKDMMRLGFNGLEMANARFGPFLCMDGWAEAITSDMKRFDNSLEKLHKRYWRKQQMSPLMELGMIIVGSLVMHHFKTKLFGPVRPPAAAAPPRPAAAEASPVAAPAAPRLRRGTPAQAQPHAGGSLLGRERAATAAAPATRPVLRPPTAVFGF